MSSFASTGLFFVLCTFTWDINSIVTGCVQNRDGSPATGSPCQKIWLRKLLKSSSSELTHTANEQPRSSESMQTPDDHKYLLQTTTRTYSRISGRRRAFTLNPNTVNSTKRIWYIRLLDRERILTTSDPYSWMSDLWKQTESELNFYERLKADERLKIDERLKADKRMKELELLAKFNDELSFTKEPVTLSDDDFSTNFMSPYIKTVGIFVSLMIIIIVSLKKPHPHAESCNLSPHQQVDTTLFPNAVVPFHIDLGLDEHAIQSGDTQDQTDKPPDYETVMNRGCVDDEPPDYATVMNHRSVDDEPSFHMVVTTNGSFDDESSVYNIVSDNNRDDDDEPPT